MAATEGSEGLLVDVDTGVLRKDHILVQTAVGAFFFMGFGLQAERLWRFAFTDAGDSHPFIARCRRVAVAVECGRLAKALRFGVPRSVIAIEDRALRRLAIAEALAKAGYDPNEPRDEHGRWTTEGDNEGESPVNPVIEPYSPECLEAIEIARRICVDQFVASGGRWDFARMRRCIRSHVPADCGY